jgi:iron-sulfur cluster repair protein YtfE (RIC family)
MGPGSGEPTEPAEALAACHERIRHFATVAVRLARSPRAAPRLILDTVTTLRRYFGSSLPQHERDEDDCVTPRLLEVRPGRAIEHALARMEGDHRAIEETLGELNALWARIAARPADLEAMGDLLHARSLSLASLFEGHLQLEEETIFPALTALVPLATRKLMLREIRERRTSEIRKAGDPVR